MNDPGVRAAIWAVAIVLAAGAGAHFGGGRAIAFALFALATLGGAAVCLLAQSLARSALGLLASSLGCAGLLVLLAFDFGALSLLAIQAATALALCAACGDREPAGGERPPRLAAALVPLCAAGAYAAWRCAGARWLESPVAAAQPARATKLLGAEASDPAGLFLAFAAAGLCACAALVAASALARAGAQQGGEGRA